MDKTLIAIGGPTAIGKTAFAIALAKELNCEILSCDSRQFFKEMSIGTAVPTRTELQQVPHHFIQHKSVTNIYTAGDFERDAIELLDHLFSKSDYAILVGGSGLYFNAVLQGMDVFPEVPEQRRQEVKSLYENSGLEGLQRSLEQLDPDYYSTVDTLNPQRLMRALEVCISSGLPYSSFRTGSKSRRNFTSFKFALEAPREVLYERINQRVDAMMQEGLLDEVRELLPFRHLNALQTVGYKELFDFLDGRISLAFAVEEIKKNTRRFAKRQMTWFRKDPDIMWIDYQSSIRSVTDKL